MTAPESGAATIGSALREPSTRRAPSQSWTSPASDGFLLLAAAATFLVLVGLQAADIGRHDTLSGAAVVFVSIAVEALPFVLIGALVSGVLAVVVPDRLFTRLGGLSTGLQVPAAALGGMLFPVCECGSVPVARRLALRGLHESAAIAFMLAAPILNPVVLASTAIAFQGRDALAVTLGRAGLGLLVAVVAGLVLARWVHLRTEPAGETAAVGPHRHDHPDSRLRLIVDHTTTDLLFMGRFVVAGAALASLAQTLLPTAVLTGIGDSWLLGPLVLMLVAFVLSLCSEADAFVAASFTSFGAGAQIAFLALGPVLDLKLSLLYGATFGRRFVAGVALVAVPIVLAGSIAIGGVLS